eukprot:6450443-Prymnesium_polylepis.1
MRRRQTACRSWSVRSIWKLCGHWSVAIDAGTGLAAAQLESTACRGRASSRTDASDDMASANKPPKGHADERTRSYWCVRGLT